MLLAKNRRALHAYSVIEKYLAGVKLKGYEVKAIREGKAGFEGSYVDIADGKPVVINLYIGKYSKQSGEFNEQNAKRPRELLLNKEEIQALAKHMSQKGKTAVPLALLLKNGKVKVEIATVTGLKKYELKQVAKERQIKKDLAKEAKNYGV